MKKILIVADDLTGSLDTGCVFAGLGAETKVVSGGAGLSPEEGMPDVLVCCTGSRHMLPSEAFRVTEEALVRYTGCFDIVYLKTDSAWRGNTSAAFMAALGVLKKDIHFVSAYPQVGRTLAGWRVYIGGEPLECSVFGRDPRTPMMISRGVDLLKMDYPVPVEEVPEGGRPMPESPDASPRVYLYDCTSKESLERIAEELDRSGQTVLAGCAGLAGVLAPRWGRELSRGIKAERQRKTAEEPSGKSCEPRCKEGGGLVLSGSANAVTFRQLSGREGFLSEKTVEACAEDRLQELAGALKAGQNVLLAAAFGPEDIRTGLSPEDHERLLAGSAEAALYLIRESGIKKAAVFGGDTLEAFLKAFGCRVLRAVGPFEEGVGICRLEEGPGKGLEVVTKSGGLGTDGILAHLAEYWRQ